ncbi:hypothetical protein SAMN05192555_10219 [Franzmannia pantelleriensis]|uniref:Uncharacterized protein n=1 Tax=Franzmannia pantelleriensis TaxID=48727 RepID=A0A1G9G4B9_9GAMM|nr:hypothetical protein [Halomonas pantelleriensis]SDK95548.1 hypothetical protein SAMN05192555_10219 [Halomonas pantelleriensis]
MGFLAQVAGHIEGDIAAAEQGQVLAGVQPCAAVGLVAAADEGDIVACTDLGADFADIADFIALVAATTKQSATAAVLVEGVVLLLGSQQVDPVTGHQGCAATRLQLAGGEA